MNWDVRGVVRHGSRHLVVASATRRAPAAMLAIVAALAAAWSVTHLAGGTRTAMVHAFYVGIVLAASRFRYVGALVASVGAGLLAGPLMPLDVAAGTSQELSGWLFRMASFVLIGQIVALLSHGSLEGLTSAVIDHRVKTDLEAALHRGEFRVVYQPLYDLTSRSLTGVEALLRWDDPSRGVVSPDQFIGDAERTGAIVPIGGWVLREAVRQTADWQAHVPGLSLKVAVNISPRQLEDDELTREVAAVLRDTGLFPGDLQLEVTETALIDDLDGVIGRLAELRALGVSIAIDDFGTGQSSLAYLHRLPVDVIKIDRSFVHALTSGDRSSAVAKGIVRLCTSLNAVTVAEGIETQAQEDVLLSLGCTLGQGYLYARPADAHDLISLLLAKSQHATSAA